MTDASTHGGRLRALSRRAGPALGLLLAWILFAALAGGDFVSAANQRLILLQTAVIGTAAVGATLIIVAGGIDLSVGATIALGTVTGALALTHGASPTLAALVAVASGTICGLAIGALVVGEVVLVGAVAIGAFAGWRAAGAAGAGVGVLVGAGFGFVARRFVARSPLPPFIVTLGAFGALRGLAKGLGDNQPVYPASTGWLPQLMHGSVAGLPGGVWILLGVAGLMGLTMRTTRFGLHAVAVGSNEETARLCGVDVGRTQILVYALGISCAGIASLLQLATLSMGDPTTAQGAELQVIAAAVLGGASLAGGEGSILGTLVGALLMTVVANGCTQLGLDNWVQECVTGAIIVGAVTLDRLRRRA
jgi:ribose/xylose/arabinose/galactoside ABC-type transport system permease subunit